MALKSKEKTILICSNYAWTVYNFRLSLISFLKKNGYRVEVLTEFDGYEEKLADKVDAIHPLFISRDGINPITDLLTIFSILKKLFLIKPDIYFAFSIKPVIYGSIAANILRIPSIVMITGLGTGFLLDNWVTRVIKFLYRFSLKACSTVFFQNADDRNLFIENNLIPPSIAKQTPGSGIDLNTYKYYELEDKEEVIFLLIARMLWDKGIKEYIEAAEVIKSRYSNARFQLLGPIGVLNRSAIDKNVIYDWVESGIIDYYPETDDVISFIKQSTCIVLPSYREGTSKVLLEAASIGRPIITTDVTGCKEIVNDGVNGYLCKVKDSKDLSKMMEKYLCLTHGQRLLMAQKGRLKMEKEFNQNLVFDLYLQSIREL